LGLGEKQADDGQGDAGDKGNGGPRWDQAVKAVNGAGLH